MTRATWIERGSPLTLSCQCRLLSLARSCLYARPKPVEQDEAEWTHRAQIDDIYTDHPYYGTRRMVAALAQRGLTVNRKRVQRLMREMGLAGMAPGKATSTPHPAHRIFPYRLRNVPITRLNQVWSTDITYIRLERGFAYLVAIMDWYSRRVLSWRISNTMDSAFCVDCLEEALVRYGKPDVFNSDQGSQFTSAAFVSTLEREEITISMDGRGCAFDNIFIERLWRTLKYEDIYLKGYASMGELLLGLNHYFSFYNDERPHQALAYRTPRQVYESAEHGGALIIDKYAAAKDSMAGNSKAAVDKSLVPLRSTSDLSTAKATQHTEITINPPPKNHHTGQRRPAATYAEITS